MLEKNKRRVLWSNVTTGARSSWQSIQCIMQQKSMLMLSFILLERRYIIKKFFLNIVILVKMSLILTNPLEKMKFELFREILGVK